MHGTTNVDRARGSGLRNCGRPIALDNPGSPPASLAYCSSWYVIRALDHDLLEFTPLSPVLCGGIRRCIGEPCATCLSGPRLPEACAAAAETGASPLAR